jgi:hypothetical protein
LRKKLNNEAQWTHDLHAGRKWNFEHEM